MLLETLLESEIMLSLTICDDSLGLVVNILCSRHLGLELKV